MQDHSGNLAEILQGSQVLSHSHQCRSVIHPSRVLHRPGWKCTGKIFFIGKLPFIATFHDYTSFAETLARRDSADPR